MLNNLIFISFIFILSISYGQNISFFQVKKKSINFAQKMGYQSDSSIIDVPSFKISNQITLRQYKQYLSSIEKDSSYVFYLSQLPKIERQINLTKNYLMSKELNNEPVIGVSMDNACNFAKWYTATQNKEKLVYRLPTLSEWISMNEQKNTSSNSILLDWTLNAFDESVFFFGTIGNGYFYQHKKDDSKSFKRKCVIGKSFRISLADPVKISLKYSYYADEGYADVGFRLIEVSKSDNFQKYSSPDEISKDNLKQNSIELKGKLVEYTTKNGQLDGAFNVFKKVNNKKILLVKGEMKNNRRIGYWTIYDENETNKIVLQRLYKSPLEFEQLIPKPSSNKLVSFVQREINPSTKLDNDFYKEDAYVSERDVLFQKRLYREILFENNQFESKGVLKLLDEALEKKEINSYDSSNFTFVSDKNHLRGFKGKVIGFRIKEDFFFDKNRKLSETRIFGLAPIYFDSTSSKKKEICWFYFPYIRKILNMDNIFIGRNFYSEIYKTNGMYEEKYKVIDIELILKEHEIWLFLEGITSDFEY